MDLLLCSWVQNVNWSPDNGARLGAAASPLPSVLMDALVATIFTESLYQIMSTGFLGKGMYCFLPKEGVDNCKQFLIVISVVTDQFGVVVSFCISDQIIYVVTPLHEDVTMDGKPCFSPESLSRLRLSFPRCSTQLDA